MTEFAQCDLAPSDLLADPNNYRFQDEEGFVYAADDRFHEDAVQQRTERRLRRDEGIGLLKASIMRNGYIPIERLVVRPYTYAENKWVVIEGNRRLTAVKWILDDYEAGVNIDQLVLDSIKTLPVTIVEQNAPDTVFRASLMGIRHVSSIKQWGGYQRSKLVATMRDDLYLDPSEIGERLGLSTQEVNRRYRAFKALEQMQKDEEYSVHARPSLYPIFHEALALPVVRDWLGWSDDDSGFHKETNLQSFYDLITPTEEEEGGTNSAKVSTYLQVRELREILANDEAKRSLLDLARPFSDASSLAKQDQLAHQWANEVKSTIKALTTIGIDELKNLHAEDVQLLEQLLSVAQERLKDHRSLTSPIVS